jgi:fibronectin-binding autotransporter adhesin
MKKIMIAVVSVIAAFAVTAHAVDRTRGNTNTNNIESGAAWLGGTAPGAGDIALFASGVGAAASTNALGADVSWGGIRLTNTLPRNITINGTTPTLTLGSSGINMDQTTNNLTIMPNVALGSSQAWSVSNSRTLTVSGTVSGASSVLTKNGGGTLTLYGANTYGGGTVVNGGLVRIGGATNNTTLGSGTLTLNGGGIAAVDATLTKRYIANNIVAGGDFQLGATNSSTLVLNGGIDLGGAERAVTVLASNTNSGNYGTTVNGVVSNGGIVKMGSAYFTFGTQSNTFAGGFTLGEGTVVFNNNSSFGSGLLTISNGTKLTTQGSVGRSLGNKVALAGDVTLGYAANVGTITLAGDVDLKGGVRTITGISTNGNVISGVVSNGGLTVNGGKLTLSGNNIYAGTTTVSNNGILIVDGDQSAATGAVTIESGSTLLGSGTIGGATTVDGFLKPGNSPGTLSFADALNLGSTSETTFEIASLVSYDVLKGDGSNVITFDSGADIIFDFGGGAIGNGTYTVLQNWASIVDNGAVISLVGTNGLTSGQSIDVSNLMINGTLSVIPEPATVGLFVISSVGLILARRVRSY